MNIAEVRYSSQWKLLSKISHWSINPKEVHHLQHLRGLREGHRLKIR